MLCVWWNSLGVVHWELLNQGETLNGPLYAEQMQRVKDKLDLQWPAKMKKMGPILLHDNARPHISKIAKEKCNDLGFEVMKHPPYSPDLAPTDYHLFRSLQAYLSGKRFQTREDVKKAIGDYFLLKDTNFFTNTIQRWHRCRFALLWRIWTKPLS
uniref:Tc1-like transposase DDE domain-containing protein n=1 Tax=Xiphophorus couchianus TaxID=32473 RepID=A0A3B5M255_9TELE